MSLVLDMSSKTQTSLKNERASTATKALEFLTKPLRDQDLLDAIRIALERHRNRREQEQQTANLRERFESLTPREREAISMVCPTSRFLINSERQKTPLRFTAVAR
jgi:FixJ family two-component response regulator